MNNMDDDNRPPGKQPPPGKRRVRSRRVYDPDVHGESSGNASKRARRDSGPLSGFDDDDVEMSDLPELSRELVENIAHVSGDREVMYTLALTQGQVSKGRTEVIYEDEVYVLPLGRLHPRLWMKYAILLLRDIKEDNAYYMRRGHRRPGGVTIEEFVRDSQIRLHPAAVKALFGKGARTHALQDHRWSADLRKVCFGATVAARKFGRNVLNFIAMASRSALDADVEERYMEIHGHALEAVNTGTLDYHFDGRDYLDFKHDAATYMSLTESGVRDGEHVPPMFDYEDIVRIFWLCMSETQKQYLTARHPIYLQLTAYILQKENERNESTDMPSRQVLLGHYALTARLMLERNRDIIKGRHSVHSPLSDAHSICEMVASVIVSITDFEFPQPSSYVIPGEGDLPEYVHMNDEAGYLYLGLLTHGAPSLYELMQRYMVVLPGEYSTNLPLHFTATILRVHDIGQFSTVPLALAVARGARQKGVDGVNVQTYCLYAARMLEDTAAPAVSPANWSGWIRKDYRRFCKHLRDRVQIAWDMLFPKSLTEEIAFRLPELDEHQALPAEDTLGEDLYYYNAEFMVRFMKNLFLENPVEDEVLFEYLDMLPSKAKLFMSDDTNDGTVSTGLRSIPPLRYISGEGVYSVGGLSPGDDGPNLFLAVSFNKSGKKVPAIAGPPL